MQARGVEANIRHAYALSEEDVERIDDTVKKLPPLTPRQLDALVDTLTCIRMRDRT